MSADLLSCLSSLFGKGQCSDCKIIFRVEEDVLEPYASHKRQRTEAGSAAPAQADAGSATAEITCTEERLPGHLVLLCGGSPRFAAQAERWVKDGGSGPAQLRVPLDRSEDLPYAKAAVQYIYTGKLADSAYGVAALLHLWRIASYLQIDGCVNACVGELKDRLAASPGGAGAAAPAAPLLAAPYRGVTELHACRELLPDPATDPRAASLLEACRTQLTRGSSAGGAVADTTITVLAADDVAAIGEVLAWLFPDAPSVLSDPDMRRHALALPPQLLEALLRCDAFGTDDEASVLLVLLCWLQANAAAVAATIAAVGGGGRGDWLRVLLLRVRLVQMNLTYLYDILDQLLVKTTVHVPWLPYSLSRREHLLLCQFAAEAAAEAAVAAAGPPSGDGTSQRLHALAAAAARRSYNCGRPWYSTQPRARCRRDGGVPYEWFIRLDELSRALTSPADSILLPATFRDADARIVSQGFMWRLLLCYKKRAAKAHLVLYAQLPSVLRAAGIKSVLGVVSVAARLTVRRRGVGGAIAGGAAMATAEPLSCEVRQDVDVMAKDGVQKGAAMMPLPLALMGGGGGGNTAAAAGEGLLVAPWAAYLQSGQTIAGTLAWL